MAGTLSVTVDSLQIGISALHVISQGSWALANNDIQLIINSKKALYRKETLFIL